jgi:hypothetical protein
MRGRAAPRKVQQVPDKEGGQGTKARPEGSRGDQGEKVTKLVTRATRKLQGIANKATKFTARNKMSSDCSTTVEQRMETIQQLLSELDRG